MSAYQYGAGPETKSVLPSCGWLRKYRVPITIAPPSLSSTLTGTPSSLLSAGARLRAIMSKPPPALVLTTMVIGSSGHVAAAALRAANFPLLPRLPASPGTDDAQSGAWS